MALRLVPLKHSNSYGKVPFMYVAPCALDCRLTSWLDNEQASREGLRQPWADWLEAVQLIVVNYAQATMLKLLKDYETVVIQGLS